jgi:hypothetical protein
MEPLRKLPKKLDARTEKVEDLVAMVLSGKVRVPWFQRGLRWQARHVEELFDSVYRGYPIGSLLFYRRPAKAARIQVGPLTIEAPEIAEAWWVVDGQQRMTALAACLTRSVPLPMTVEQTDPYVLFLDVEEQKFEGPPRRGEVPSTWVPLPELLDASRLTEWTFGWQHSKDSRLRRLLFDAGKRIREYPIPLYLIDSDDGTETQQVAQQIFYRTNKAGEPLDWREVHKALFGTEGEVPSTLEELSSELEAVGMGRLSEERLLTSLFGLRGLDPTRSLSEHYRKDPAVLRDAVKEALPTLRRVLSFLGHEAQIPHTKLLPKPILLDILTRFFGLHAEPSARSRALLSRWFWRTVLGAGAFDDRTLRRRGIKAISESDEEASIQRLLALVDRKRVRPFELPEAFDGRSDANRIVLATLAHLEPRDLESGRPLDVASLLEKQGGKAFARIVRQAGVESSQGPANRVIQPMGRQVVKRLLAAQGHLFDPISVAASHAVSENALSQLAQGDFAGFLTTRSETLTNEVRRFTDRMAAWDHNDRPSIEYVLRTAESS